MATLCSKRRREDGYDELDLGERKKPRQLPFRMSPTAKHASLPPHPHHLSAAFNSTPAESSSDDDHAMSHDEYLSSPRSRRMKKNDHPSLALRIHPASDADSDLEMTDTQHSPWPVALVGPNPAAHGRVNSPIPPHLVTDSRNISGGRTATPIHSHFTANMKPEAMLQASTSISQNTNNNTTGNTNQETVPFQADCETWWKRRRLPSPISEDEISPTTTIKMPPGSDNSTYLQPPPFNMELGRYPNERPPVSLNSAAAAGNYQSHHQTQWPENWGSGTQEIPTTSTSDENNSLPTAPGRPKVTIAMGFRADCEKCQQRVPGHYSHIIRL